jgi:hypothetical protein
LASAIRIRQPPLNSRALPLHLRREPEAEQQLARLCRRLVHVERVQALVDLRQQVALRTLLRHAQVFSL